MKRFAKLAALMLMLGLGSAKAQSGPLYYNPQTEVTLTGTVVAVQEAQGFRGGMPFLQVTLKDAEGQKYLVYLGPTWYLEGKLTLAEGDKITVVGSLVRAANGEWVVAREVEHLRTRTRLQLRDEQGFPRWIRNRGRARNRLYSQGQEVELSGKVVALRTTTPPRGFYPAVEVEVETSTGKRQKVLLGPTWFVQDRVKVGDEITVLGAQVSVSGEPLVLAREMVNERTQERTQLRTRDGVPVWQRGGAWFRSSPMNRGRSGVGRGAGMGRGKPGYR